MRRQILKQDGFNTRLICAADGASIELICKLSGFIVCAIGDGDMRASEGKARDNRTRRAARAQH